MSREMELLFQASRTSPVLYEAATAVESDLRNLRGENERLKREVEAQMQAKLDAQSLLANICQAINLSRMSFDLNDTWGTAAPKIIERLTEIMDIAEAAEAALADTRRALEEIAKGSHLEDHDYTGACDGRCAQKMARNALVASEPTGQTEEASEEEGTLEEVEELFGGHDQE